MSQTATIHYVSTAPEAREFRDRLRFEGSGEYEISEEEFDEYYEGVASEKFNDGVTDENILGDLWVQWNRGSHEESDEFLRIECLECGATFIDREENHDFIEQHRSLHVERGDVTEEESETMFDGNRSMMVCDIIEIEDTMYIVEPIGWDEISLSAGGAETKADK